MQRQVCSVSVEAILHCRSEGSATHFDVDRVQAAASDSRAAAAIRGSVYIEKNLADL